MIENMDYYLNGNKLFIIFQYPDGFLYTLGKNSEIKPLSPEASPESILTWDSYQDFTKFLKLQSQETLETWQNYRPVLEILPTYH